MVTGAISLISIYYSWCRVPLRCQTMLLHSSRNCALLCQSWAINWGDPFCNLCAWKKQKWYIFIWLYLHMNSIIHVLHIMSGYVRYVQTFVCTGCVPLMSARWTCRNHHESWKSTNLHRSTFIARLCTTRWPFLLISRNCKLIFQYYRNCSGTKRHTGTHHDTKSETNNWYTWTTGIQPQETPWNAQLLGIPRIPWIPKFQEFDDSPRLVAQRWENLSATLVNSPAVRPELGRCSRCISCDEFTSSMVDRSESMVKIIPFIPDNQW